MSTAAPDQQPAAAPPKHHPSNTHPPPDPQQMQMPPLSCLPSPPTHVSHPSSPRESRWTCHPHRRPRPRARLQHLRRRGRRQGRTRRRRRGLRRARRRSSRRASRPPLLRAGGVWLLARVLALSGLGLEMNAIRDLPLDRKGREEGLDASDSRGAAFCGVGDFAVEGRIRVVRVWRTWGVVVSVLGGRLFSRHKVRPYASP